VCRCRNWRRRASGASRRLCAHWRAALCSVCHRDWRIRCRAKWLFPPRPHCPRWASRLLGTLGICYWSLQRPRLLQLRLRVSFDKKRICFMLASLFIFLPQRRCTRLPCKSSAPSCRACASRRVPGDACAHQSSLVFNSPIARKPGIMFHYVLYEF
jgi:hypothetical protein